MDERHAEGDAGPRHGLHGRAFGTRIRAGFVAASRYLLDDFHPYIFRTDDYGSHWTLLTDGPNGIPANEFVRVVREDPTRKGLLYAGTEFGMYVSLDDGRRWRSLKLNLPAVPVTDIAVHDGDLVLVDERPLVLDPRRCHAAARDGG